MEKLNEMPYFSGEGHDEKRSAWVKENLEGKISDSLMSRIRGEASIRWNTSGGRYSGCITPEMNRVIRTLNNGVAEEDVKFPLCDWNNQIIEDEKRRRGIG